MKINLNIITIALIIFTILSVAICSDDRVVKKVSGSDQQNITITPDETFKVKIPGNITTGYGWYLVSDNKNLLTDVNIGEHNGGDYQQEKHEKGFVGGGGVHIFTFKSNNLLGETKLKFENKRPWEEEITETFTVNVNVENAKKN